MKTIKDKSEQNDACLAHIFLNKYQLLKFLQKSAAFL